MARYLSTRIITAVPVVLLVTLLVFVMGHLLPGDPVLQLVPPEEAARFTQADLARLRAAYGLDRPLPAQYVSWLWRALHADLGRSLRNRRPVDRLIEERLPVTGQLAAMAVLLSLACAIPLGGVAALHAGRPEDTLASTVGLLGLSVPSIFTGTVLLFVFAYVLRVLPAGGYVAPAQALGRNLLGMLMPAFTLGTAFMGSVMRVTRTSVVETLRMEYVTTARAKGVAERRVVGRHALRNALVPVTTIVALQIGGVLGGTFITEQIFAIPGVGTLAVGSIFARDFPVVQGVVMFFALLYLFINLAADVCYAWLDPRIRYD